jgi:hypothetical protein
MFREKVCITPPNQPGETRGGMSDIEMLPCQLTLTFDLTACSKSPSSKAAASEGPEAYPLGYVEDLNDARTTLAGFFSMLSAFLGRVGHKRRIELLHLGAPAFGACHGVRFMLL